MSKGRNTVQKWTSGVIEMRVGPFEIDNQGRPMTATGTMASCSKNPDLIKRTSTWPVPPRFMFLPQSRV